MENDAAKFIEAAKNNCSRSDYDSAIHNCNKALKLKPEDIKALLCLGEAYKLKAEKDGEAVFFKLSIETYKKVLNLQPHNEIAHYGILQAGIKGKILDKVAVEFREKIKTFAPEKTEHKKIIDTLESTLSKIPTIATLNEENRIPAHTYRPNLFIRIGFDFVLFPASALLVLLSLFDKRFHQGFLSASILLLFYAGYRIFLAMTKR